MVDRARVGTLGIALLAIASLFLAASFALPCGDCAHEAVVVLRWFSVLWLVVYHASGLPAGTSPRKPIHRYGRRIGNRKKISQRMTRQLFARRARVAENYRVAIEQLPHPRSGRKRRARAAAQRAEERFCPGVRIDVLDCPDGTGQRKRAHTLLT